MNFWQEPEKPKLWSQSFLNNTFAMQLHKLLILYDSKLAPADQQCYQGMTQNSNSS